MLVGAWSEVDATVEVRHIVDGQALVELLLHMVTTEEALPALVLLDLNMPTVDGWEALSGSRPPGSRRLDGDTHSWPG
jgi:CheY-like chemotaxis protein